MDGDPRMAIRCIMAPDQAEHLALKEYATFKLMQVIAERDTAIIERDNVLAEKKAAFNERDSAFLQRDIAFAERDAAMHERDNAMAALENARGLRGLGWNQFKRQPDMKGRDATLLQMSLPGGPFMVEEAQNIHSHTDPSMLGFINNNTEKIEPMQQSPQANNKSRKKDATKVKKEKTTPAQSASDGSKPERKRKHSNNSNRAPQEGSVPLILPVVPYLGQEEQQQVKDELQEYLPEQRDLSFVISTPIPYCSCTGIPQPCYRWGNGGWQSACCTNTLSMHPLPMNPMKRGYRLPGRKMSAGAFQKLVKRFTQEGVDLSQPIDLKDYWAKHGTNRYITIK